MACTPTHAPKSPREISIYFHKLEKIELPHFILNEEPFTTNYFRAKDVCPSIREGVLILKGGTNIVKLLGDTSNKRARRLYIYSYARWLEKGHLMLIRVDYASLAARGSALFWFLKNGDGWTKISGANKEVKKAFKAFVAERELLGENW